MSAYPLFIFPVELAEKTPKEWSVQEAKSFFNWLLSVHPQRIDGLLQFFNETLTDSPEGDLVKLGEHVAQVIQTPEFSRQPSDIPERVFDFSPPVSRETISEYFRYLSSRDPQLTNAGYALAVDMGLLVAQFLLDTCGDRVKWSIVRRPKSDVSYHLPVLVGFGKLKFDPILISTSQTYGLLHGDRGPTAWRKVFTIWKDMALQPS